MTRRREAKIIRFEPAAIAGRVPPHDLDAEAAVLSAAMLVASALDRARELLKPEHFYSDANKLVFEACVELSDAKAPVDIVSVASYLRDRQLLAEIGGPSYLAQLSDATPAVAHVASHAWIVFEKWRVRQMIATCQRLAAEGYGDVGVVQEWLNAGERSVYDLAHSATPQQGSSLAKAMTAAIATISAAGERGDGVTGISTGYEKLDLKTAGLHNGDVLVVAARPGMGKTALVLNIGANVASPRRFENAQRELVDEPGQGVVIFSLEMPREQLAARMACTEGRVDLGRARKGWLQPDDWRRLTEAAAYLSGLPIWIEDAPAVDVATIRAKVRRYQAEASAKGQRVGLVVIDYLQLMKGREGVESREQAIAEISRGLKELAKEVGVAVIALSQLNRDVEKRPIKDRRPNLSDLRESGAIEQDADTIIFIYRDEYYLGDKSDAKGIAELIIAKQRNGPTGRVLTRFNAACTRFDNLAAGDYPEAMEDE